MTEASAQDLRWLDAAVRYASPFMGTTGDSPCAAALVVAPHDQTLIARAVTAPGGRPHPEALALASAGFEAAGATLYLTLQPCHQWGRTPPCTDAIVRSGVMRVVIGAPDPDPDMAAAGMARLQSAGVEVILTRHAPSAALNAGRSNHRRRARPYVTAMLAISADGSMGIPRAGTPRHWLDLQRSRANAILLGAATAREITDPLVIELPGLSGRTPRRIVLAGAAGIDRSLNLIGGFSGYRTAVIAETAIPVDAPVSVEVIRVEGADGRPDLKASLAALANRGIQNLLVEPGQRLMASLLHAKLVDCFGLMTTSGHPGGPPASHGRMADLIAAGGLVATDQQSDGPDTLTFHRRPA